MENFRRRSSEDEIAIEEKYMLLRIKIRAHSEKLHTFFEKMYVNPIFLYDAPKY